MNEITQPRESRNDSLSDSKDNWVFIVLTFSRDEFDVSRQIILYLVPKVKQLKMEGRISDWHFRCGSKGADVSFRLRCGLVNRDRVARVLKESAEELEKQCLLKEYNFHEDPAWIGSNEKFREKYESRWGDWWWLIECDELLSEVAYKVLARRDYAEEFFVSLHELFNMLWLQEIGGCFTFQSGISKQLEKKALLPTDESATRLKRIIDWRKTRSVEKVLAHESVHIDRVEPSRKAEIEKIVEDGWEKRKMGCIIFFELLKTGLVKE